MQNELIKEIKGKTYHFKFKSKRLVDLEKLTGKNIIQLLQDISISNICRLLKYGCIEDVDEYQLLDDLLEEMTYDKIVTDLIIPICVVSGIISKKDADNINDMNEKVISERKN